MPVRNEADFIERSLGAVLAQDYPHDRLEVFVADGISTDDTREIVRQLAKCSDIPVIIIENPGKIAPTGFNAAFAHARGEIIVRVDGHCEIAPNYVTQCVQHLADGLAVNRLLAGVGGPIETISETVIGETIALAMSSPFGVGGSSFRTANDRAMFVDTIAFPAYTRSAMDRAGGLDTELIRNQDDEYNFRLRAMGYRLLLTPRIRSRYYSRGSLVKLWRQYYQYGFYKVRVMQKHPRQMRPRQFAPLVLVLFLVGGALFAPFSIIFRRLWLFFICVYFGTNLVASLVTASKFGWRHLPLLPLVFTTLHFSYGLGFLSGLWVFRRRWSAG